MVIDASDYLSFWMTSSCVHPNMKFLGRFPFSSLVVAQMARICVRGVPTFSRTLSYYEDRSCFGVRLAPQMNRTEMPSSTDALLSHELYISVFTTIWPPM